MRITIVLPAGISAESQEVVHEVVDAECYANPYLRNAEIVVTVGENRSLQITGGDSRVVRLLTDLLSDTTEE